MIILGKNPRAAAWCSWASTWAHRRWRRSWSTRNSGFWPNIRSRCRSSGPL